MFDIVNYLSVNQLINRLIVSVPICRIFVIVVLEVLLVLLGIYSILAVYLQNRHLCRHEVRLVQNHLLCHQQGSVRTAQVQRL